MGMRTLIAVLTLLTACGAHAAASGEAVTPAFTSVEVLQSQALSARFRDAAGNPSVGENVTFTSETCGTFSNGLTQIVVPTGAGGVVSTNFTAGAEFGLRCTVRASAGAQVTFNVITYRLDQVRLGYNIIAVPNPPRPGQGFTLEAYMKIGGVELPNVDLTVAIIRGPDGAGAFFEPTAGNTGALTRLQVNVFPEGQAGVYDLEFTFKGVKFRFPLSMGALAGSYQDMWWTGARENGWGMSLLQHGDRIFAVLFVYDNTGKPTWYVMSGGEWDSARSFSGPLYSPRGSPFFAYDASRFTPGNPIGTLKITFQGANEATLDYTINGITSSKFISRQPFGPPTETLTANVGDMYWGGPSQNGWGVATLQQYRTFFIVWFTYDAAGLPVWYVLPSSTPTTANTFEGRIYRTTGSAWLGEEYRASQLQVIDVGPFRLRLTNGEPSALEYTVESRTGTLNLMRQGF
jgi:hypothetical protein